MTVLRRILFISQYQAEEFRGRPNIALISITDPEDRDVVVKGDWGSILRLKFKDIDPITFNQYVETDGLFDIEDARHIQEFLNTLPQTIDTCVVHCKAGISRSGGVAKAIAKEYKLFFSDDYYEYNKYIYMLLRDMFNNRIEQTT